ncbi:MAG TPA: SH3 domain-containing protein [Acidimicrobiia bacterium]|nr:SH3 domain-containing protein [Acidimicrobiia bacterium]
MTEPFTPHHAVAGGGATTWTQPDPARPGDGHLDASLPVQVLAETTGWAHVRCSNGYETWIDARMLAPIPDPAPAAPPTHRVGGAPAPTRPRPEPGDAPDNQLVPGLEVVELLRWADWSRVRCSNGWETWVEAGALTPVRGHATGGADPLAIWVPIGGAALVILGSFLAWYRAGNQSLDAWDLRWVALLVRSTTDVAIEAGPVLLACSLLVVLAVGIAPLLSRPVPAWAVVAPAGFATFTGMLGFWAYLDFDPRPKIGIGLVLTVLGGLVMLGGALARSRTPDGSGSKA